VNKEGAVELQLGPGSPAELNGYRPKTSLLYMPTHRLCSDSLRQLVREAEWAATEGKMTAVTVCLIEHRLAPEMSGYHGELLRDLRRNHSSRVLHIDQATKSLFVDRLLIGLGETSAKQARLRTLLLPEGISYGAGPNLAYLIGQSLRVELIHRRDSDVFLDPSRPNAYPIELELLGMYASPNDLPLRVEGLSARFFEYSGLPAVVGTSTFGDTTFDRRDLFTAGSDFLVRYQQLGRPGISHEEVLREATEYLVESPKEFFDTDFFILDEPGRIEMEACCLRDVFRVLPEMPTDILGCDYLSKDIAWQVDWPSLYHSRKMRHVYDPERFAMSDDDQLVEYYIRDLKYILMGRIWSAHNERVRKSPSTFVSGRLLMAQAYAESFVQASEDSSNELTSIRKKMVSVFEDSASKAQGGSGRRLRRVADYLHEHGSSVEQDVHLAVSDFAFLIQHWSVLGSVARDLSDLVESWMS
jgi:Family of unknown function (DUF6271)